MLYEELIENLKNLAYLKNRLSPKEYEEKAEYLIKEAKPYGFSEIFQSILFGYTGDSKKAKKKANKKAHFPIRNQKEAEYAFNYLVQYRDRLPYKDFIKLSRKLIGKHYAGVCNFPSDKLNSLFKFAGFGVSTKETILTGLNARRQILEKQGKHNFASVISGLMKQIDKTNIDQLYTQGTIDGIATLVSEIDRETKLARYYNRGITPPEDFLFSVTVDDLKKFDDSLIENVKTGSIYHTSDLNRIDIRLLKHFLGEKDFLIDGFIIDRDHFREWIKEASYEEAETLDKVFEWSGVKPLGKRVK